MGGVAQHRGWAVVVPVKELTLAKTRLASFGDAARADLALAMAADVVLAAQAAAHVAIVLVVTNDARAAAELGALGARVVADVPDAGLNAALADGARLVRVDDAEVAVAAVSGDLPALRSDELDRALVDAAAHPRALVADAAGTGTTMLTARPGVTLEPRYGPGSRQVHLDAGAWLLDSTAYPGLARDVDTVDDLQAALGLGVGPRTAELLRALGMTGVPG